MLAQTFFEARSHFDTLRDSFEYQTGADGAAWRLGVLPGEVSRGKSAIVVESAHLGGKADTKAQVASDQLAASGYNPGGAHRAEVEGIKADGVGALRRYFAAFVIDDVEPVVAHERADAHAKKLGYAEVKLRFVIAKAADERAGADRRPS